MKIEDLIPKLKIFTPYVPALVNKDFAKLVFSDNNIIFFIQDGTGNFIKIPFDQTINIDENGYFIYKNNSILILKPMFGEINV